jgi:hypothetical protein
VELGRFSEHEWQGWSKRQVPVADANDDSQATNTIVTKSSAFIPDKSDELAKLRRKMWSDLLHDLQQEVLNRHEPPA